LANQLSLLFSAVASIMETLFSILAIGNLIKSNIEYPASSIELCFKTYLGADDCFFDLGFDFPAMIWTVPALGAEFIYISFFL